MVRMPGSCAQDITAENREDPREEVPVESRREVPDPTGAAMDRQPGTSSRTSRSARRSRPYLLDQRVIGTLSSPAR